MLKTWDIFDTLIARRCIFPHVVFQIMENVSKVQGFAQARISAEQSLAQQKKNYNLDDIYDVFQKNFNVPDDLCASLKQLEYDVEFEQAIPIAENLNQVKAGDILISDMYLPKKFIQKLLDKVGLLEPVEIVITSNGKYTGRIWKQLAEQNQFVFHIGDNEISDIKNPHLVGFDSSLSVLSQPNVVEQFLLQKDFNFAAYIRELRLKNPFTEEIKRLYWQFFTWNIAVLIIFVSVIDEIQKKYGFEYLGFCGRDTYYLWKLYEKFKSNNIPPPPYAGRIGLFVLLAQIDLYFKDRHGKILFVEDKRAKSLDD